jgi:hypothetical protein
MLDHERGLRRRQPTPRRDHLRQPTPTSTTRAHGRSLIRIPIDGKGRPEVRFDDGTDAIVGGSRVER